VEIYVCGQSLTGKGGKAEDVVVFADVAVSGLTALVNLQADNYAYVPLGN
jgi:intracellular sulfur oxidation DsrE/DsrF family protein